MAHVPTNEAFGSPAINHADDNSVAEIVKQGLVMEALAKYHICPDGNVVTKPSDCLEERGFLPKLEMPFS